MKLIAKPIKTAITTGPARASYSHIYKMHRYWSKKSAEIIKRYIETYTDVGDIILDPFCGYGVTIFEALKLERKVIGIDLNPMATFINRVVLQPVNLSRLKWAFRDIQDICEQGISEIFSTRCPTCHGIGTVEFIIRKMNEPLNIAYRCECTNGRLFKKPDEYDNYVDEMAAETEIAFWYPKDVLLPTTQKENFKYVHELFTRRHLLALSMILNAINQVDNLRVKNVMKLAFTACLDKCSRLKPLSTKSKRSPKALPSLSEGWVASRFYTPPLWQEVNPWVAFSSSFNRIYIGKRESNDLLCNAIMTSNFGELQSGKANVMVLQGSSDEVLTTELSANSVDYVLTDPPFGSAIQYLTLSTFYGTWLGFDFDYGREIVVDARRGKTKDDYCSRLHSVFCALERVMKPGSFAHIFCNDITGPYLHELLKRLEVSGIQPHYIVHQPPANSFSVKARRERKQNYGSYIVTATALGNGSHPTVGVSDYELRSKLCEITRRILSRGDGEATASSILHSAYQQLDAGQISTFAKKKAVKYLSESIRDFARLEKGKVRVIKGHEKELSKLDIRDDLRRAVLDAKSLVGKEKDNINRVRQLVLIRFQEYGVTPDDISDVEADIEKDITPSEQRDYYLKRFANLLCLFGNKLGYHSTYPSTSGNVVTWTKQSHPDCNFEICEQNIRVFSTSHNVNQMAEWGTVPKIKLERKLYKWCQDNPNESRDLIKYLNPLDGPSYEFLTQGENRTQHSAHLRLYVVKNVEVCRGHKLMQMQLPNVKLDIAPGQFFHIICDPIKENERSIPLTLRRPFSIHGAQYEGFDRSLLARSGEMPIEIKDILERWPSRIDFLYKIVGVGTRSLSEIPEGTVLDAIGPCGKGFSINDGPTPSQAIIVAGGIGIAPLIALVERLRYLDKEVHVYLGAISRDILRLAIERPDSDIELSFANGNREFVETIRQDFREIGVSNLHVCTDDGTVGDKGFVTEILDRDLSVGALPRTDVCIYACGPHDMLRSVAEIARIYSIECQVLLEERMACGIGACLSCTCNVYGPDGTIQKKRVCRDGPVFRSTEIKW